jgi:hypothetical protein
LPTTDEPFAMVIFRTADRQKVDKRTRSKLSRLLRYSAEYKLDGESLAAFVRRKGGINKCASRFTRCLGRHSVMDQEPAEVETFTFRGFAKDAASDAVNLLKSDCPT